MTELFADDNESPVKIYEPYVRVWVALLALTAMTVLFSTFHLGRLGIWVALAIASLKGGLVVQFFMHLKEEPPLFRYMFLIAITILAIFIGLTFFDTPFR